LRECAINNKSLDGVKEDMVMKSTDTRKAASWKRRLYLAYVSSGQSNFSAGGKHGLFASRASHITHIIANYIDVPKESKILDLGCGHGAFVYFLDKCGFKNVAGVDGSAEQVELASKLEIPGIIEADITEHLVSCESSSVDVIILMDVLEHLTHEQLFSTLDEVYRILTPNGRCIIHVPNAGGIFGMSIRYGDLTHEMCFTSMSANQLLRTIGFKSIACHEEKPLRHGLKSTLRRAIWDIGTFHLRLLHAAESGQWGSAILSQNMLIVAKK